VGGKEEAFPSYLKNAGYEETCGEFFTTDDTVGTEVIVGNRAAIPPAKAGAGA
jgi:hypothetical protein